MARMPAGTSAAMPAADGVALSAPRRIISPAGTSVTATRNSALRGSVSAVAHESFDGALVVKSLGREADETGRFREVSHELRDANIAVGRIRSIFDPLLEVLPNIGILLVILLGVGRVASGAADPGDVVSIAYLFTVVAFPVRAIGWVLGELPRSVVSWERVRAVLDERGSMAYGEGRPSGTGAVALDVDDVTYRYADSERDVLKGISLAVEPGKVVAVVGPSGSGKSTLTSLLTRLVDPQGGTIRVDGDDIRDLTHDALASAIAVVPQGTFLFDDSVRENVTLGGDFSDEQVWDALRTVQASDFVSALPDGLGAQLGERGTSLSGGQRQRLSLARALVRNPRLLVMDDATSAVDPEVEQRILRALAAHTADNNGPTVLVVAYRKATIALADEVVFLDNGVIADRGTHDELVARSADYRDLVNAYDQAREALS